MRTDPGAGAEVRRGSDVDLTVSKGPERYAVPAVVGTAADAAARRLTAHHLAARGAQGGVQRDGRGGPGRLAATPRPGRRSSAAPRSRSSVSKGRQPDPRHRLHRQARRPGRRRRSTDAGLTVDATQQENSDTVPRARVISQTPSERHPVQGRQGDPRGVQGPGAGRGARRVGKQRDEATRLLKAAGFKVEVDRVLGGFFGTVRSSRPGRRQRGPKGSTVTLTIV